MSSPLLGLFKAFRSMFYREIQDLIPLNGSTYARKCIQERIDAIDEISDLLERMNDDSSDSESGGNSRELRRRERRKVIRTLTRANPPGSIADEDLAVIRELEKAQRGNYLPKDSESDTSGSSSPSTSYDATVACIKQEVPDYRPGTHDPNLERDAAAAIARFLNRPKTRRQCRGRRRLPIKSNLIYASDIDVKPNLDLLPPLPLVLDIPENSSRYSEHRQRLARLKPNVIIELSSDSGDKENDDPSWTYSRYTMKDGFKKKKKYRRAPKSTQSVEEEGKHEAKKSRRTKRRRKNKKPKTETQTDEATPE